MTRCAMMRKMPHYMNANKPIASLAYSRLRELTRDDVLDILHPALRPDIVAVLDENAELRGKLASVNGALVGSRDARARTEQELAELREAARYVVQKQARVDERKSARVSPVKRMLRRAARNRAIYHLGIIVGKKDSP